jgi:hypothetical protein
LFRQIPSPSIFRARFTAKQLGGYARRGDGKRFVARADEKLTAFMELESAIRGCGELACRVDQIFSDSASPKQIWIGRRMASPGRFFSSFRPAATGLIHREKEERSNHVHAH